MEARTGAIALSAIVMSAIAVGTKEVTVVGSFLISDLSNYTEDVIS